jgi:hypothetical protein
LPEYIRIAIQREDENAQLLDALRAIAQEEHLAHKHMRAARLANLASLDNP